MGRDLTVYYFKCLSFWRSGTQGPETGTYSYPCIFGLPQRYDLSLADSATPRMSHRHPLHSSLIFSPNHQTLIPEIGRGSSSRLPNKMGMRI